MTQWLVLLYDARMSPIQHACALAGGHSAIARALGITRAAVSQWATGVRPIPEERCPAIECATSGAVTCEELRPDVSWVRVLDAAWPHPKGRPLVDHARPELVSRPDAPDERKDAA